MCVAAVDVTKFLLMPSLLTLMLITAWWCLLYLDYTPIGFFKELADTFCFIVPAVEAA